MTNQKSNNSMILLRGAISGLDRSRRSHDFLLSEVRYQMVDVGAVEAVTRSQVATGIGLISMAGNGEEDADGVEFELDGKQVKGWLWMMPMRNGDIVEVVAEPMGKNRYLAYAVKRDNDDLLAVYPHATAGRKVQHRPSVETWIWFSFLSYLTLQLLCVMEAGFAAMLDTDMQLTLGIVVIIWILISVAVELMGSRKLSASVQIAELIFQTFGWPDVENIDLERTSQENRRENKLPNFGSLYFRYK